MAEKTRRARSIMVLGTSSHAGKSTVAAAICRSLRRKGLSVAPFKAQNMSNNSWVTPEGGEIGRAQAVQARAADIEPHVDMNPILLKPSAGGVQVVALGRVIANLDARGYYARIEEMRAVAQSAYDRLAARYDVIVLEGAGSPAEINLRAEDLVNMAMAEYAGSACILVADIDRGGVFASILGTLQLMPEPKRARMAGVVINKFRGDASLLDSCIREITDRTGVPILGVLPWTDAFRLDEEDSLGLAGSPTGRLLDIAVLRFPHISNFTDFAPLERIPDLSLRYVAKPEALGNPDLIILPGSKNVRADADWLRSGGFDRALRAAEARAIPILGICGGYQILGTRISDPFGVEGPPGDTEGLGLLPVRTRLEPEKELCRVEAENLGLPFLQSGVAVTGYEIHAGQTEPDGRIPAGGKDAGEGLPALRLIAKNGRISRTPSGCVSVDALVSGCYLHGLFDSQSVRRGLCDWLSARKGVPERAWEAAVAGADPYEAAADWLESHFDPMSLLTDS